MATKKSSDAPDAAGLAELAGKPPKLKSRGGRPRKTPAPEPATPATERISRPVLPTQLVRSVVRAPYTLAAKYYGPHWALTDEEIDNMIPAHLDLAERYLPRFMEDNAPLFAVLWLHTLAVIVRLGVDQELLKEPEPAPEKPTDGGGSPLRRETRFGEVKASPPGPVPAS